MLAHAFKAARHLTVRRIQRLDLSNRQLSCKDVQACTVRLVNNCFTYLLSCSSKYTKVALDWICKIVPARAQTAFGLLDHDERGEGQPESSNDRYPQKPAEREIGSCVGEAAGVLVRCLEAAWLHVRCNRLPNILHANEPSSCKECY